MKYEGSRIVGKFEEDPKCSGSVWRNVVTVNNTLSSSVPILLF
jgi:hypothetical protein